MTTTVLITGAAGHLGRAVAAAFATQGARRVLVDRNADALRQAYGSGTHNGAHAGTRAEANTDTDTDQQLCLAADLLDATGTGQAVQTALARFGAIDVLCHLAGGFDMGEPVHATREATLERMLDLNVRTFLRITEAVVPHMLAAGRGRIVTVGAMGAQRGGAHMGTYAASKAALQRLTESMSAELKGQGINVNCVLPSIIDTPDNRAAMPGADPQQWVSPAALADVIAFLGSDGARAVHGAALPVTGLV